MIFPKNYVYNLFVAAIFFSQSIFSQVIFRDLPNYKIDLSDNLFFDISDSRSVISLNGSWKVRSSDSDQNEKISVHVPSIFTGEGEFIFEKSFSITKDQISNNKFTLVFFGLNYSADISVNKIIIYRHTGGEFPFSVLLPRDILRSDKNNLISVKLRYNLDSENTIPLKQRFLFPQNFGGIFRDVYIHLTPNVSIEDFEYRTDVDSKTGKAVISYKTVIDNKEFKNVNDSTLSLSEFKLRTQLLSPGNNTNISSAENVFSLKPNKQIEFKNSISVSSPLLWSPDYPQSYILRIEVWRGETMIDRHDCSVAFYNIQAGQDNLTLNGNEFKLYCVTYSASFKEYGPLISYDQMKKDMDKIKQAGFNSIRFSKSLPHPFLLNICRQIGLLVFIELPLANLPEGLAGSQTFVTRSKNYLSSLIKAYGKFSIAGIGLGSSYMFNSSEHQAFLGELASHIKKLKNTLTFASFIDSDFQSINKIDFYGIEILNQMPETKKSEIEKLINEAGRGRLLIGDATYTVNQGQTDGYINKFSFEAQAKFFDDIFSVCEENNLAGFIVNSIFDIRGDYKSLISGYNKANNYNIGLIDADRDQERLAFKVISARLKNTERVTIPIGSEKDDAPMIFIIMGLLMALLMGILVNSGRKFREDASRALLRPYNFFADVRDQRIISAYHSFILAIIISIVSSLIFSNLFYYIKNSVFFEKIILAFGSTGLISGISYLAWNPFKSLVWMFLLTIIIILLLTLIITASSFFVRTKVYLSSVFFTVVWAMLPVVLLIPVGIVLYRLLNAGAVNLYLLLLLVIFVCWLLYRLLKGVSVIFDVSPGGIYFYGLLSILILKMIFLIYFQVNNSIYQYIKLVLKQNNILG